MDILAKVREEMREYRLPDGLVNINNADTGVIVAIIIYFIAKEPKIGLIKLECYLYILKEKFYEETGGKLFSNVVSEESQRIRNFYKFIDFMQENALINRDTDVSQFELTKQSGAMVYKIRIMFGEMLNFLDWVLSKGKQIPSSDSELKRIQEYQKELDSYFVTHIRSSSKKGHLYERFIGTNFEKQKYKVQYVGIPPMKGGDGGIDLICSSDTRTLIVQCKNWTKNIPPREIRDLVGAVTTYKNNHPHEKVKGAFFTTSSFSKKAFKEAGNSGVEIELFDNNKLPPKFPIIKCCVEASGCHFYYLPTDHDYDRKELIFSRGDCYCLTVLEAESKGFKRCEIAQLNTLDMNINDRVPKRNRKNKPHNPREIINYWTEIMDRHTLEAEQQEH